MLYKKAFPNAKINLSSFLHPSKQALNKQKSNNNHSDSNMPTAISMEHKN